MICEERSALHAYNIMDEVFLPCMHEMDMVEDQEASTVPAREGRVFRMPASVATGYFWTYAACDFAVSVTDMTFLQDYRERCGHPQFVSVRYYHSGSVSEAGTNRTIEGPYLEGHALPRVQHWDCLCKAGIPLRNVEIMLAPPFCEHCLRTAYRDEPFSVVDAFSSIDGLTDFPEMVLVLKQLEAYRGRGASARLFYRSKVEEAVALVVDKSRTLAAHGRGTGIPTTRHGMPTANTSITSSDMHAIERVRQHLVQEGSHATSGAELARIACMGQTKLRTAFKQAYHCTIVEYRQQLRCKRAAELLATSDMPIAQVAAAVGYQPNAFATLFTREYGSTPSAYRAALR